MVDSSFILHIIKKTVNRHGLFLHAKKPWDPEEVPTAFIFFHSSDQQRTNPSLGLFHHHQFLIAICSIIISVSLAVFHSLRFFYQTLGNMSTTILCFCSSDRVKTANDFTVSNSGFRPSSGGTSLLL
jgi:hypothetical protein